MCFDALNNFSSMHFVYWKPLKVGNQPRHHTVNLPNIYKKYKKSGKKYGKKLLKKFPSIETEKNQRGTQQSAGISAWQHGT